MDVHSWAVRDRRREQFFEVPYLYPRRNAVAWRRTPDWHGPCAARRDLARWGLHNVKRAGFGNRYSFHAEPSQVVLPRLAAAGSRFQFAFIDGWHTFDHTLVDFFFIDKMLDIDGIIVVDDVDYPSIRRLCHFI